jgi:hypothetical protein
MGILTQETRMSRMAHFWFSISRPLGCLSFLITFVVVLFLVKLLWAWTVPDLFPEAVKQNFIAPAIGWLTALKIAIFLSFLAWVAGIRRRRD